MSNALNARLALAKHDFHFTHSLGQNFLLDDGVISRIADAAGVEAGDRVLEIGAGAGVLTAELAARGARVLALELDEALTPVLDEVLAPHRDRVTLAFADALKADLRQLTGSTFGENTPFSVVANLPYYITADVLLRLVKSSLPIERITVLVQQEAAERIMARPDTKPWCQLAATIQYFGRPDVLLTVPPEAFTPRPHVMSSLLQIELYGDGKPCKARDEQTLLSLIGSAFAMRRKTLANNLTASFSISRERALRIITGCGLDERVRGEALPLEMLCALADKLQDVLELLN